MINDIILTIRNSRDELMCEINHDIFHSNKSTRNKISSQLYNAITKNDGTACTDTECLTKLHSLVREKLTFDVRCTGSFGNQIIDLMHNKVIINGERAADDKNNVKILYDVVDGGITKSIAAHNPLTTGISIACAMFDRAVNAFNRMISENTHNIMLNSDSAGSASIACNHDTSKAITGIYVCTKTPEKNLVPSSIRKGDIIITKLSGEATLNLDGNGISTDISSWTSGSRYALNENIDWLIRKGFIEDIPFGYDTLVLNYVNAFVRIRTAYDTMIQTVATLRNVSNSIGVEHEDIEPVRIAVNASFDKLKTIMTKLSAMYTTSE